MMWHILIAILPHIAHPVHLSHLSRTLHWLPPPELHGAALFQAASDQLGVAVDGLLDLDGASVQSSDQLPPRAISSTMQPTRLAELDAVLLFPPQPPEGLLIWLHGVGDFGSGRHMGIRLQRELQQLPGRWGVVMLTAPFNQHHGGRAWFNPSAQLVPEGSAGWNTQTVLHGAVVKLKEDEQGLESSTRMVSAAVREAARLFEVIWMI